MDIIAQIIIIDPKYKNAYEQRDKCYEKVYKDLKKDLTNVIRLKRKAKQRTTDRPKRDTEKSEVSQRPKRKAKASKKSERPKRKAKK